MGWRVLAVLVTVLAAVAGGFAALGGYFAYETLLKAERRALESRFELTAQRVVSTAQRAASYGIALPAQTTLPELLRREAALDPAVQRIDVVDLSGRLLFSSQPLDAGSAAPSREGVRAVQRPVLDDLGQPTAQVQLWFDRQLFDSPAQRLGQALGGPVWQAAALAAALTLALGLGMGGRLRRAARRLDDGVRAVGGTFLGLGFRAALSLVATLSLGLGLAWIGLQAQRIGQADITPHLQEKARSVARASASLVELALGYGVPLQDLKGLDAHFASVRRESPEIFSMALLSADGGVLLRDGIPTGDEPNRAVAPAPASGGPAALGQTATGEVMLAGAPVARVEVRVDPDVIGKMLRSTLVDVAFLALVSLLIALETMALLVGSTAARELAALEARVASARRGASAVERTPGVPPGVTAVRAPLFLFMLAEELTRPFLPGYASALAGTGPYADLLGSLPLVVALAVIALCQVPFAALSPRIGRREGFAAGSLLTGAGFCLAALSADLSALVLSRVLCGAGFALVFVCAQGQVVDASGGSERARSLAVFARAILVAAVCGPLLGGMMVDRWGVAAVFMACAALCLMAMVAATVCLPRRPAGPPPPWSLGVGELPAAWRSPGLPSLLLGCALPAKLLLAAFTFYLVPLELQRQGWSGTEIGRLLLVYPLVMVVAVPLFAALADQRRQRRQFVIAGGLVAGTACLVTTLGPSMPVLILALTLFGLGQAMSMTPQSAMVSEVAATRGPQAIGSALGVFRLVERTGSALGPAFGAALLGLAGFAGSVVAAGAVGIAGSLVYALLGRRSQRPVAAVAR